MLEDQPIACCDADACGQSDAFAVESIMDSSFILVQGECYYWNMMWEHRMKLKYGLDHEEA